ncbi:MAG TPA: recombination protein RecR, partial [Planctomycetes bacterium]|nr:recombination protein RecR [Planctomycetota bacterium]
MAEERLLDELIDALSSLPGIGQKSAERLAYHLLKMPRGEAMQIAEE